MRTALVLLFLLAVAAIPGSVLPQRGVNIEKVDDWFTEHPDLAPVLDRLGAFEVFASVWFSAIYLLLFTSLIGCIPMSGYSARTKKPTSISPIRPMYFQGYMAPSGIFVSSPPRNDSPS